MSDEYQPRPEQDEAEQDPDTQELDGREAATDEQDEPAAERVTRATPQRRLGTQRAPEGMIRRPQERL